jgi:hypothetical protein
MGYFINVICLFVSFIGGGNRRTRRKPSTCRMSLTNFITYRCTPRPDRDSNSQHILFQSFEGTELD